MSFSAQVAGFGVRAAARAQEVRQGVTIKLLNAVISDTPVDEGTARANWQLTEGSPATGTIEATAKGKKGLTVQEAQVIARTTGDAAIFLTNNLPYIQKLEYGGYPTGNADKVKVSKGGSKVNPAGMSKQAPEGMVRKNVLRFARLIKVQVGLK